VATYATAAVWIIKIVFEEGLPLYIYIYIYIYIYNCRESSGAVAWTCQEFEGHVPQVHTSC
jgi:hypothetical protein